MRRFLILAAVSALAGCQSIGAGEPVQVGHNKFEVAYTGSESLGARAAQAFCASKGFANAAVFRHQGNKVSFVCQRGNERPSGFGSKERVTCMNSSAGAKVCGVFE